MVMAFGELLKDIFMKDNGLKIGNMDKVYISITQARTKVRFLIF